MTSVWDAVIGQPHAVDRLRRAAADPTHAYLFVGPHGSTTEQAARAFAAAMITGTDDADTRDARLVMRGEHPDVIEVQRTGASIAKEQADAIIERAWRSPTDAAVKVLVLHEFHLVADMAAGRLLKTIEEPPPSTRFIILAESVPPGLVTIASRCVRVDFRVITDATVAAALVADGIDPQAAELAATAALGDLDRARVLATDPALAERRAVFANALHHLDGSGHRAAELVDQIETMIDAAAAPLRERQQAEADELTERIARYGERGSGKTRLEERHKRELRRFLTDELRAGLATLSAAYRDAMVAGRISPDDAARAIGAIDDTAAALGRNVNSALALQQLVWSLPLPG